MNEEDRRVIVDLFDRLREVEARSAPRNPEAERLIREEVAAQPAAPYYMAQTIVVQNQALAEAQRRIADLEAEGGRQRGGLFSGLFGSEETSRTSRPAGDRPVRRGEGGFLAGAAQTAVGVAGGLLLGNLIAGTMFGDGAAAAADPAGEGNDAGTDAGADAGADFDASDFDIGF